MLRALARLPLHTTALAFVSFGIVLVQVQVILRRSAKILNLIVRVDCVVIILVRFDGSPRQHITVPRVMKHSRGFLLGIIGAIFVSVSNGKDSKSNHPC